MGTPGSITGKKGTLIRSTGANRPALARSGLDTPYFCLALYALSLREQFWTSVSKGT